MKKLLTICFFLLVPVILSAQSFLNVDFSGGVPPTGWTVDANSANWKLSASANALGSSPECKFDYSPVFTGTTRLISPAINLTGITNLKLNFKHMIDHYSGVYTVGVATRSGSGEWTTVWSKVNPTGNVTENVEVTINNSNVGTSDFQICWFFSGYSNNIDYWYIDDILLFSPLAHDVMVKSILTLPEYEPGFNLTPQAVLSNFGTNTETFNATCVIKVNNQVLYNQNCAPVTLTPGQDQTVSFPNFVLSVPNDIYEITVTTNLPGDLNPANDSKTKFFDTYTTAREMVILEIGTGTWCVYCPGASMGAHDLIANGKNVGVVKYHNGDSFTNTYSNARNTYYGISGFPTAVFDGVSYFVGGSNTQSMYANYLPLFEARQSKNSAFSVEIFGSNAGLNYDIQLRVRKLATTPASVGNTVVHLALTESNIPFNWQGQSMVHNAERLMAPNENGTPLNFSGGNEIIVNLSFALNSAWVLNSLELVSFIQNLGDKEILQGTKLSLLDLQPLPVELTSFTGTSSANGIILNWSTASEINNHGFEIEKSTDAVNFHTIGFIQGYGTTTESKDYSFADKFDYSETKTLYYRLKQVDYNGNFEYSEVIEIVINTPISYALSQNYPNPFNPSTKITYAVPEAAFVSIKIYDITGQEAAVLINEEKQPGIYELEFSAAGLSSGVYFYKMTANNYSSVKKLSIMK
jgi:hypothetical protein